MPTSSTAAGTTTDTAGQCLACHQVITDCKLCAGCKVAEYCDKQCQKLDKFRHRGARHSRAKQHCECLQMRALKNQKTKELKGQKKYKKNYSSKEIRRDILRGMRGTHVPDIEPSTLAMKPKRGNNIFKTEGVDASGMLPLTTGSLNEARTMASFWSVLNLLLLYGLYRYEEVSWYVVAFMVFLFSIVLLFGWQLRNTEYTPKGRPKARPRPVLSKDSCAPPVYSPEKFNWADVLLLPGLVFAMLLVAYALCFFEVTRWLVVPFLSIVAYTLTLYLNREFQGFVDFITVDHFYCVLVLIRMEYLIGYASIFRAFCESIPYIIIRRILFGGGKHDFVVVVVEFLANLYGVKWGVKWVVTHCNMVLVPIVILMYIASESDYIQWLCILLLVYTIGWFGGYLPSLHELEYECLKKCIRMSQ